MTGLWYLRRAIPWPAVATCIALAATLVATSHRWPSLSTLVLPLSALAAAAAVCFVFDEPAVAITAVTPRSRRWALALRGAVAALPLAAGLSLLLTAPDATGADWALVQAGLVGAVGVTVLAAARRQVAQPGAAVAALVIVCGLAPLVAGSLLGWRSLYPLPDLTDGLRCFWAGAAVAGVAASLVLVLGRQP